MNFRLAALGPLLILVLSAGCVWHEGIVDLRLPQQILRLRVGGLWQQDERYYVDRHAGYPTTVELFGGGVEPDEAPVEALKREWREELGVEPVIGPLRMVVQRYWETNGVRINQVDLIFEIVSAPPFGRPRESNHDPKWLTIEEIRRYKGIPQSLFASLPLEKQTVLYVEETQ